MIFNDDGIRELSFDLTASAISQLRKGWENHVSTIPSYPGGFNGKGVVICAGGVNYFTCAWICITILRKLGCNLPIEMWYKRGELNSEIISEVSRYGVDCKCVEDYSNLNSFGWALKPLTIKLCSFKEVLYLDADNICLKDPSELFDLEEYKRTGAIFWPDFWNTAKDNPIWEIMNVPYSYMKEQESGQILIDKEKSWEALNLAIYLNSLRDVYYKLLLGDKDTFRFSWLALKKSFYFVDKEPSICGDFLDTSSFVGNTMLQFSPDHIAYFLHRNLLKWHETIDGEYHWKFIKEFVDNPASKRYDIGYSHDLRRYYMDITGDVRVQDFTERFGDIEIICHKLLNELRLHNFYQKNFTGFIN